MRLLISGLSFALATTAPVLAQQTGAVPAAPPAHTLPALQNHSSGLGPGQTSLAAAPEPSPEPSPDPRRMPPAKPGALTLDQVLTLAEHGNPTLLAARRNLDAVRAQEIQAGVRQNPYFNFASTSVTEESVNSASPYFYSFGASRLFERGQKRRWRLAAARSTTALTADQLRDLDRGTRLGVEQAFTQMLIAKAALALAEANLNDFNRELTINRDRYQAGDLGKLDYERLDLQKAQYESDLSTATINLAQAGDQLQTLLGATHPSANFDVTGAIVPPVLSVALPQLEAKALAARPDYQAALAGVSVAQANVKLAYAEGTTDPTIGSEYDHSVGTNSVGFTVNVPFRIFDRNQGNKKTAQFSLESSRLGVNAVRNQVVSDVDQAWVGYTQSKTLAGRYSGHYLDEAADVLSIAQFAYEHGGLALIDYLDALRSSRQTTADALAAYSATWLAIHQLNYAAATPVLP